jgi:hypothetical protein
MGYLDAQRVPVVVILEITGIRAPIKHDSVFVGLWAGSAR